MSNFSRQIENRNFLSPIGFKFTLNRAPKSAYFCNKANIPELILGTTVQPNYLRPIPQPGEIIEFGDLTIRFLVDEDLTNYMEIQKWMRGLGFPERGAEFGELLDGVVVPIGDDLGPQNIYSDGTLQVLGSNFTPKFEVVFNDLFPYRLTTLDFDATSTDVDYFTAEVGFKYTMYKICNGKGEYL